MENHPIARVIAVHKERYQLYSQLHGEFFAQLKAAQYYQGNENPFPTAGDLVEYQHNPFGDSLIVNTLPRKSYFRRFDGNSARNVQSIAANFDTVFILASANQDFNIKRLRRYLSAARSSGGDYAIVITKMDLVLDIEKYMDEVKKEIGERCPVFPVSAALGQGLKQVAAYLRPDSVSVFLGSSGVGKSTLVNALAGRKIMDVNGIREDDAKGRHTTTHRQMIALENGAWILDTPGMRELGLVEAKEGVSETFSDVARLATECRFSDCTHTHEPGCAVQKAVQEGVLSQARLEEFLALEKEARRQSRAGRDETIQRQKAISKFSRQFKKGGGKHGQEY